MKTVTIISCFGNFDSRTEYVEAYFKEKGYDVIYIVSDFVHTSKMKRTIEKENVKIISVPEYKKNLSIKRIISHRTFAKAARSQLEAITPDIIYCMIPPNFLTKYISGYKRKNKNVKLVFDIYDLWPGELLLRKTPNYLHFLLKIWAGLRDNYVNEGDAIITECDLYQRILGDVLDKEKTKTIYIAKKDTGIDIQGLEREHDTLHLCYLGSINNIINVKLICEIVKQIIMIMPVTFHIIGGGEKEDDLSTKLKEVGAKVIHYGKIYDEERKHAIFAKCHFGINVYDENVSVGLTLKSLCYFEAGLPVINNIKEDTYALVEKYNAGINIVGEEIDMFQLSGLLNNHSEIRRNARTLYENELSEQAVMQSYKYVLNDVK